MSDPADRGKVAEGKLQKEFAKLSASKQDFCYERIYDARSSKGKMSNPRSGDFCLYYQGRNILIEVKEVDHIYRLPKSNFDTAQRARMRLRALAGSEVWVVVYHSPNDTWRLLSLGYFGVESTGSWDFREIEALSLKQVIERLICQTL